MSELGVFTRVEIIDHYGRVHVWDKRNDMERLVSFSMQDGGLTLKIFLGEPYR